MTINEKNTPAVGLRSARSTHRLNQIDKIRANGVSDFISLPQLVVCGDQSSGKSSVLERLTGIPFPRGDGLCTRFPTEIILRHSIKSLQVAASIHPHSKQSSERKTELRKCRWTLSDMSDLPAVIKEAATLMKIRGYGDSKAENTFAADVLRIEITAPTGLHLTIVDLPGLISVQGEDQIEDDVQTVRELVESYLSNSRTIILAVIQAPNDIANQSILQLARKHDPEGQRTVGILTKTDLVNQGAEHRIANLAANLDSIKLKLGFFLLRNPCHSERKGESLASTHSQDEMDFFLRAPWKDQKLDWSRVGIEKIKPFLQELLDVHIERELPKVWNEISNKLRLTETQIKLLGHERSTASQIRLVLTDVSMRFYQLVQAACDGNYQGSFTGFFSDNDNRLRARVHASNQEFSDYMREKGERRKLVVNCRKTDPKDKNYPALLIVDRKDMEIWTKRIYSETRGRELPGNYNYVFLAELFREQSSRWLSIALDLYEKVSTLTSEWIDKAVHDSVHDTQLRHEVFVLCTKGFDESKRLAYEELMKLLDDEKRQPTTYNHYYTDNVQQARNETHRAEIELVLYGAFDAGYAISSQGKGDKAKTERIKPFVDNLVSIKTEDMVQQACNEGIAALEAYYKVARKTFVDNVCRQVIERHLLAPLPDIFCPRTIAELSCEELLRIGSESKEQRDRRKQLTTTAESLRKSLEDLHNPATDV
ncbi:hypothetical protein M426DRAFT_74049 [Hypoxylon sp. CI-4A]|nr:hypothetical protein M426DRAFT_74049 [Hypoxylon sp. CI-4A]